MKPEAQRIAIAEACGYLNPRQSDSGAFFASYAQNADGTYWGTHGIPDYLNSLDAMHEACNYLRNADRLIYQEYGIELCKIVARYNCLPERDDYFPLLNCDATAAQRAEAFLRTLNLWTDES